MHVQQRKQSVHFVAILRPHKKWTEKINVLKFEEDRKLKEIELRSTKFTPLCLLLSTFTAGSVK